MADSVVWHIWVMDVLGAGSGDLHAHQQHPAGSERLLGCHCRPHALPRCLMKPWSFGKDSGPRPNPEVAVFIYTLSVWNWLQKQLTT